MATHRSPNGRAESLRNDDICSSIAVTLTVAGAAKYSGLSTDHIRDLVRGRNISTLDRGANGRGHIHILRESLDAWLNANTVPAVPRPAPRSTAPGLDADNDITFEGEALFS
jgi:hypothetical protein